jgi:hypothetical protein
VAGTSGTKRERSIIAAQIALYRDALFPTSRSVLDTSFDAREGAAAWPANPVLYGGPDLDRALSTIAPDLPFVLAPGTLTIGGETFEGDGIFLVAVVPARADAPGHPGHPEFLLYAGTGSPGVEEINALPAGNAAIFVGDAFGELATGEWKSDGTGGLVASLSPHARREKWRTVEAAIHPVGGAASVPVHFAFVARLEPEKNEDALVAAGVRGLDRIVRTLEIAAPPQVTVYVYPDRRSKQSLSGNGGDGHAVPGARALHVLAADPSEGGAFERLVSHEGTHLLATSAYGPAGSAFMAEGLAVWVAGGYGGTPLDAWRKKVSSPPPAIEMLGGKFRQMKEEAAYPIAGLFVASAVESVGVANVRDHLLGATRPNWADACAAAKTTPEALDEAFEKSLR